MCGGRTKRRKKMKVIVRLILSKRNPGSLNQSARKQGTEKTATVTVVCGASSDTLFLSIN